MKKIMVIISFFLLILLLISKVYLKKQKEISKNKDYSTGHSIDRLLMLAKEPLGKTMYVWGGGWNEEDSGAGKEAVTLGISPVWGKFALKQDKDYDFNKTRYQIHDGLDCSGYIGWLIYNLLETENGKSGYVVSATEMAEFLAKKGLGKYTKSSLVKDWQAGDIMSMKGHVWLSLGSCEDGSVVVLHASPPGITLSGTLLSDGKESMAVELAKKYMKKYYPEWYKKYSVKPCEYTYLTQSARMRWNSETLVDVSEVRKKDAKEVLQKMFGEGN